MAYQRRWHRRTQSRAYSRRPIEAAKDPAEAYIKKEFLALTPNEMLDFGKLYKRTHGQRAYSYFVNTYTKWQSSTVSLSGQTLERLLQCVPPILIPDKQFYLLGIEVERELHKLVSKNTPKLIEVSQLNVVYKDLISNIKDWDLDTLKWFVRGPFEESTLQTLVTCIKNAAVRRVIDSYQNCRLDLEMLGNWMNTLPRAHKAVHYTVELLNTRVRVGQEMTSEVSFIPVLENEVPERFKEPVEKYLLDRLLARRHKFLEAYGDHEITQMDLGFVCDELLSKVGKRQRISIKYQARGAAGVFDLVLEFEPLAPLLLKMSALALGLLSLIGASVLVAMWLFSTSTWLISVACLYGIIALFSWFVKMTKEFRKCLERLSPYVR